MGVSLVRKIFFLILFFTVQMRPDGRDLSSLRLWNSKRGQVLTWVRPTECFHFTMAGGLKIWRKLLKTCGDRHIEIYLTRWKSGEVKYLRELAARSSICLGGPAHHSDFQLCPASDEIEIWEPPADELPRLARMKGQTMTHAEKEKHLSAVFYIRGLKTLVVGDSPKTEEAQWRRWAALKQPQLIVRTHTLARQQIKLTSKDWGTIQVN